MKALIALALALASGAVPRPELELRRLDCGSIGQDVSRAMPVNCYLVRHGEDYLLWDAGLSTAYLGDRHPTLRLSLTIGDQLAGISVRPDQIGLIGISHHHFDHTGQAAAFSHARLLIGSADLEALRREPPPPVTEAATLAPWIEGRAPVTPLEGDHDVYGDGSVVMLATPGHTPGHFALLVRLASGPVLLSGDLWHSRAGMERKDPGETGILAASRERFLNLAGDAGARIIVQHDDSGR